MPDLNFNNDQKAIFPTKHHENVTLSKNKWDQICNEPERFYYRENAENIATTLINPDTVRYNRNYENQFIYYKRFETIRFNNREIELLVKYWAVVIDKDTRKVCTVYPVTRPKSGDEYKEGE